MGPGTREAWERLDQRLRARRSSNRKKIATKEDKSDRLVKDVKSWCR
jgi:hypothetical protein